MTATKTGVSSIVLGPELGRGYFGCVHEATVAPQGSVAVKVIDCEAMADLLGIDSWDELRQHLFAEAENLSRAEHDHVVRVFGVHHSENKDEVFIVCERCDRDSLGKLAQHGPLPLGLASTAIRHALMGLEALHVRGMVHRDLKPSNVLRQGGRFKLGDFGLVTDNIVKGYASRQGYTEHLAPEAFDVGVTSPSTDVWAMGMTAFRVLNGEPWYAELLQQLRVDRIDHVAAAARIEELVTSSSFTQKLKWMPHVPKVWRRFVNKALAHNSTTRYRDGGTMLSGLNRLGVPHGPSWECTYSANLVRWQRDRGSREEVVEWRRPKAGLHEFVAFSRARSGPGRLRTLLRSDPSDTKAAVVARLQEFFETRSE